MKTEEDILTDIYKWLNGSTLVKACGGKLYKCGDRPTDSTKEDVVINVLASTIGEIQNATIDVLIFVPDIHRGNDVLKDRTRIKTLMTKAMAFFKPQGVDDWRVELEEQTNEETADHGHQHVIANRLKYQYCSIS